MSEQKTPRGDDKAPGPVAQVDDQGLTSTDSTPSTMDTNVPSALGGRTATRSVAPEEEN